MEENSRKNAYYVIASIYLLGPSQQRFVWSRYKESADDYKMWNLKCD